MLNCLSPSDDNDGAKAFFLAFNSTEVAETKARGSFI